MLSSFRYQKTVRYQRKINRIGLSLGRDRRRSSSSKIRYAVSSMVAVISAKDVSIDTVFQLLASL